MFPPIEEVLDDDGELALELALDGIPMPDGPGEELVDVNPPGRFKARAGWPPALVLDGWPEMAVAPSVNGEPPSEPAGCRGLAGDGGVEPAGADVS